MCKEDQIIDMMKQMACSDIGHHNLPESTWVALFEAKCFDL